jgi:long-subunit acyl-CoA synthetase (AMP-forming)
MTETCGLHTGFAGPDYVQNPEAVGPGMPVDQIRIVDADIGKPLAANTFGMVQCRGPNIMKCYVDNPTATAEALSDDGWLTTGDLGIIDEMGFLWIRDRGKYSVKV